MSPQGSLEAMSDDGGCEGSGLETTTRMYLDREASCERFVHYMKL